MKEERLPADIVWWENWVEIKGSNDDQTISLNY